MNDGNSVIPVGASPDSRPAARVDSVAVISAARSTVSYHRRPFCGATSRTNYQSILQVLMLLRFVRQIVSNDIAIKLIRLNTAVSLHIELSNHRLFVSVCPK